MTVAFITDAFRLDAIVASPAGYRGLVHIDEGMSTCGFSKRSYARTTVALGAGEWHLGRLCHVMRKKGLLPGVRVAAIQSNSLQGSVRLNTGKKWLPIALRNSTERLVFT